MRSSFLVWLSTQTSLLDPRRRTGADRGPSLPAHVVRPGRAEPLGRLARHNSPRALAADVALPPGTYDLERALAPRSAGLAGPEVLRLEKARPCTLLVPLLPHRSSRTRSACVLRRKRACTCSI